MNYKICVIGLGYVGLPLAIAFAEKFKVVGLDVDKNRINELRSGFDRTLEVDKFILSSVKKSMTFSTDIQDTKSCNVYIVTVPTPVGKDNRPNLKPLIEI